MEEVKISVENKSDVERNISIEIPREMYNEKFERAIRKAAQQARVKGFRPGRAPRAIIQKLYGTQIHQDVLGELVSSAYHNAVETHELKVVGYPEINIDGEQEEEGNFKVSAGVAVFPEPQIEGYEGLKFEVEVEEYRQELFDEQVKRMQDAYAEQVPVEGRDIAEQGDTALLDYQGTIDGESFAGSEAEGSYIVLGSNTLPGNLEAAIVGQKVAEEREILVDFPEDEAGDMAGKTANYKVTLRGIYTKKLPALDDEFAKKSQLGETYKEFSEKLEELLKNDLERKNKSAREEQYFKALIAKNEFEVPQPMCDEEIRNFLFEMGLLDPQNQQSRQFDVSGFRETLGEAATFRVRQAVALNAIMEKEKVESSKEDVEAWLEARAVEQGRGRAEIDAAYGYPKNLNRLQHMVARERLVEKLIAKSEITEVKKAIEEESAEPKKKAPKKKSA